MFHRLRQSGKKSLIRQGGACGVALLFLLAGFTMASGPNQAASSNQNASTSPAQKVVGIPATFSDLAERLAPTVVNIQITKVEKVHGAQFQIPEGPFEDFFERFFKENPRFPDNFPTRGAGSGVIISKDGYILTNNHVVKKATEVTVMPAENQEYRAEVVGRDPKTDLALLKIDAKESLPAAKLGDSDRLKVGDWVVAIGSPFGLSHTVTSGIVSAKGRVIGAGPYDDFIQTDASINPGNSGGPLFNLDGELVGINTAILSHGEGIGFAIPVNTAKPLIPQLIATGEVARGYLGVSIQPITPELEKALSLDGINGALVADVVSSSPAEKAGIQRGDIIVAYEGQMVENPHHLTRMVAKTSAGEEVPITVLRDGEKHSLHVQVGKLVSDTAQLNEELKPADSRWGLRLQDMSPSAAERLGVRDDEGVLVVGVESGSPAAHAGMRRGDVILEVNRQPVNSVNKAKKIISKDHAQDSILLLVKRDQRNLFIALAV